jgi:hypothetical protein
LNLPFYARLRACPGGQRKTGALEKIARKALISHFIHACMKWFSQL